MLHADFSDGAGTRPGETGFRSRSGAEAREERLFFKAESERGSLRPVPGRCPRFPL